MVNETMVDGRTVRILRSIIDHRLIDHPGLSKTKDAALMDGVTLHGAGDVLLRDIWLRADDAAKERWWQMKATTRSQALKDAMNAIEEIQPFHTTEPGTAEG